MSEWGLEASHLSTIPCSLQKYTELLQHSQKPSDLSLAQRQLAFRYWVAYELYGDTRQHSRKSFACPLLGCSIAFDNFASCLAHLTECAWLLNAWYWCPFCNQPERFTVPELRLTTPGSTEASSTEFKHAHSSDQRRTNAKSGAARFLMNVGSKLGFKKPSLSSRIGAGMNSANRNVQDRTPSSLPISRPTGIVPELPETVFPRELHSDHMLELSGGSQRFGLPHSSSGTNMDRWILPNKDYLQGLQSPAIASSGFPPETMGVPTGVELDTNPLLLAELSGDCINGLYYPETMELPTNVDGTCQPLDPMGAAAVGADQSARFSQPVPILSNYSTRSGISCHSRDVFVQMERLPVYTQDTRFDHVYSPETLQTESFRSNASGTSLPLLIASALSLGLNLRRSETNSRLPVIQV
ncbi:MAG: hypothetical protein LQ346_000063 [Caloplaca aetnensis]|nr:MAG: hypothetical protein LQ346_000063 [Caloplaca aetnensis]